MLDTVYYIILAISIMCVLGLIIVLMVIFILSVDKRLHNIENKLGVIIPKK